MEWGKRKDGQAYPKSRKTGTGKRGSIKAGGVQLNLLGKTKKTPVLKTKGTWDYDNKDEQNTQNRMDGGLVEKILMRNGEPVKCSYCDKTFTTDADEPYSCGDMNYLHEDCEDSLISDDRLEPILTVIYGDDKDDRKTIGTYHDDTEGDFTPEYHSTDAWRGYYNVIPSREWTNVVSDNILSCSGDACDLEEYDQLVRRILDDKGIKYARVFSRTSNIFSTGFDMFIKKKDLKKYNTVQKQIKSIQKILRDPKKYHLTALTGESTLSLHGDELMVAVGLLEKGKTPKEAFKIIKEGEEGLKKYSYFDKGKKS